MEIKPGKLWIVGIGPGDPRHLTLYAVETIKKADLILARKEDAENVQKYLEGKRVEGSKRWGLLWREDGEPWVRKLPGLSPGERRRKIEEKNRERDAYARELKEFLASGKHAAILDGGDPTMFSLFFFWVLEAFSSHEIEIVPGIGAMNAAFASLKICADAAGARFITVTEPRRFMGEGLFDGPVESPPPYPGTHVFYMALDKLPQLTEKLKQYYSKDMPAAVVYHAGSSDKERIVKGTLETIVSLTKNEEEKWLGLFIVGQCIDGPVIFTPS